jgi:peptidoglycan hydrolase-like amidase
MKILTRLSASTAVATLALGISAATAAAVDEPKYIWVCETGQEGGCANPANIYRQKFETQYLGNVLPLEWSCSWNAESVKSGAVAVRSYGWWRVNHPRSSNYDIYGNSNDQNWEPEASNSTCNQRIGATAGTRMEYNGGVIFAAYRHETGNPTKDGGKPYLVPVTDPHTISSPIGPGECQLGSKSYGASGYSYAFILHHYYTGVTVATGANYFVSEYTACTTSGRFRVETWFDTSDGSQFTRSIPLGPCIE